MAGVNSRPKSVKAYSTVGGEVGITCRVRMPSRSGRFWNVARSLRSESAAHEADRSAGY